MFVMICNIMLKCWFLVVNVVVVLLSECCDMIFRWVDIFCKMMVVIIENSIV